MQPGRRPVSLDPAPACELLKQTGFRKRIPPHLLIHLSAQSAFFATHGMVSTARNRWSFCTGSLMYVSSSRLYISAHGHRAGVNETVVVSMQGDPAPFGDSQ